MVEAEAVIFRIKLDQRSIQYNFFEGVSFAGKEKVT